MKVRLVPKRSQPSVPSGNTRIVTGYRLDGDDAFVQYRLEAEKDSIVKVYLFDALGHFIAGTDHSEGTLRIPEVRLWCPEDPHCYQFYAKVSTGEQTAEYSESLPIRRE